jgi:hypothetical protein
MHVLLTVARILKFAIPSIVLGIVIVLYSGSVIVVDDDRWEMCMDDTRHCDLHSDRWLTPEQMEKEYGK